MQALNLFLPLTKVDAAQRLVYGVATAETEDRSGEICDYASTKPRYAKWSRDMLKASDGKSLGNLRAMHGKVAAGKITSLTFDDVGKRIEICAKVVDDAEWAKVCEGVYTGFSQGGNYVERWQDESGLTRYTAEPTEVSLVDLPCLPQATFEMIKADGGAETVPFKQSGVREEEWDQVWRSRRDGATFHSKAELYKHHADLDLAKVGARNSAVDLERIQAMHDNAVALGAQCDGADKAADGGALAGLGRNLQKMLDERAASSKALEAIVPVLDDILQRVTRIESQPRPAPIAAGARAVAKIEDVIDAVGADPELAARLAAVEREALSLEAIKAAHRRPQKMGLRV